VIIGLLIASCNNDQNVEQTISLPTYQDVEGYWRLEKIIRLGEPISFNDYPEFRPLINLYCYFGENSDRVYELIAEHDTRVSVFNGTYKFETDDLWLNANRYQVKKVDASSITLINWGLPAYELIFSRIPVGDYPEILFSTKIDEQSVTSKYASAYDESSSLILYGSFDKGLLMIYLDKSMIYVAGQTYPLGVSIHPLYIPEPKKDFGRIVDGQVTIKKITNSYIDLEFSMTLKNNTNDDQRVKFTDGKFKSIIKRR
jgi:hypothetical protein